jgi:hypothetical protein
MITFCAKAPTDALRYAKKYGAESEYSYKNHEHHTVYFQFIGVLDILELAIECDKVTMWYDIVEMNNPMERKHSIIPSDEELYCSMNR